MNIEQKQAIDIALEGHNLLLLGSAGTGKSFVVNNIAKCLEKVGKHVQITCSTGIACSVYSGKACTSHQFTGISDGRHGRDDIVDVIKNNPKHGYVIDNITKVDTLIVDECSMISKQVFDTIHQVCKIKDPNAIFGGIQIIFVGISSNYPLLRTHHMVTMDSIVLNRNVLRLCFLTGYTKKKNY